MKNKIKKTKNEKKIETHKYQYNHIELKESRAQNLTRHDDHVSDSNDNDSTSYFFFFVRLNLMCVRWISYFKKRKQNFYFMLAYCLMIKQTRIHLYCMDYGARATNTR